MRCLGKSLLGRVRKVRKVRKVYSLIFGRRANSENEYCGNSTSSRAQAVKTFRTFRTFRNTVWRTKRRKLRAGASAARREWHQGLLRRGIAQNLHEAVSSFSTARQLKESVEKYRIVSGN
jgi:hypothetical protein